MSKHLLVKIRGLIAYFRGIISDIVIILFHCCDRNWVINGSSQIIKTGKCDIGRYMNTTVIQRIIQIYGSKVVNTEQSVRRIGKEKK